MASSYDVTDSAMKGYALVWSERAYLFRLAIFPLLIKFVCTMTVIVNGLEFDFTKQSLLMLPSYFADGWVMSHLVRLIYFDQRWPFRPTGNPQNDMVLLRDRAGGIMAGTVCFALLEFLKTGVIGLMFNAAVPPGAVPGQIPPPSDVSSSPYTALTGMALIAVTIWAVRYLWVYIPLAAGFSGRSYLSRVGGFTGSIRLLGVWMICCIPILFLFILLVSTILGPLQADKAFLPAVDFIVSTFRVAVTMVTTMITTAGIAYVIRSLYEEKK